MLVARENSGLRLENPQVLKGLGWLSFQGISAKFASLTLNKFSQDGINTGL
jgi:hypothetical protein